MKRDVHLSLHGPLEPGDVLDALVSGAHRLEAPRPFRVTRLDAVSGYRWHGLNVNALVLGGVIDVLRRVGDDLSVLGGEAGLFGALSGSLTLLRMQN